ncbi:hypothetical protein BVIET440_90157 [Burkholderia vietnamiensis]
MTPVFADFDERGEAGEGRDLVWAVRPAGVIGDAAGTGYRVRWAGRVTGAARTRRVTQ